MVELLGLEAFQIFGGEKKKKKKCVRGGKKILSKTVKRKHLPTVPTMRLVKVVLSLKVGGDHRKSMVFWYDNNLT